MHLDLRQFAPDTVRIMDARRLSPYAETAQVRLDPVMGCHIWNGVKDRDGYPMDGRTRLHRAIYEQEVGPIAAGLELDHLCRNRACIRPEHLEPVTRSVNGRRKSWARRSQQQRCRNGHDLYVSGRRTPNGGKVCLECAPV